jgi:hypothetical protein
MPVLELKMNNILGWLMWHYFAGCENAVIFILMQIDPIFKDNNMCEYTQM